MNRKNLIKSKSLINNTEEEISSFIDVNQAPCNIIKNSSK